MSNKETLNIFVDKEVLKRFDAFGESLSGYKGDKVGAALKALMALYEIDERIVIKLLSPTDEDVDIPAMIQKYVDDKVKLAKEYDIYLPVFTALQTGLRMSELREITWQHIDIERRLITLPHTKTNRPRSVPITAKLAAELDAVTPKTGPLFRGQQGGFVGDKQWRDLLKPLQDAIPKFKDGHRGTGTAWHLLRHTFASRYVQAGGDIYRLAKILGHSNVTTTQIYAHLAPAHDEVMERI